MSQARRFLPSLAIAALVACAVLPARADFGPAQGGGAAQTPWSTDIDGNGKSLTGVLNFSNTGTTTLGNGAGDTVSLGSTNVLAFGGTSSTFPALRYGSAAGEIELCRGDGSADSVTLRVRPGADFNLGADDSSATTMTLTASDAGGGLRLAFGGTNTVVVNGSGVTLASGKGISSTSDVTSFSKGIALKDVTSAPTVTAGYGALYVHNEGGNVSLKAVTNGATYVVVGPWIAWTPTGSWTSNTTYAGYYRVVGKMLHLRVTVSTSGAPTTTNLTINLPSGFTADETVMLSPTTGSTLGMGTIIDSGATNYGFCMARWSDSLNVIPLVVQNTTAGQFQNVTESFPMTWGATDQLQFVAEVPIQ